MPVRKYQVYVSCTHHDLAVERQAAVEIIVESGNIPAGMELSAGDGSHLPTVRRWIEGSDVFLLILGGRYGPIAKGSVKSCLELEYNHAVARGKPLFAAVMSSESLARKGRAAGPGVVESENRERYELFRQTVRNGAHALFDDPTQLKLIIHAAIINLTRERNPPGWIRGDEFLAELRSENVRLAKRAEELEQLLRDDLYDLYGGLEAPGVPR